VTEQQTCKDCGAEIRARVRCPSCSRAYNENRKIKSDQRYIDATKMRLVDKMKLKMIASHFGVSRGRAAQLVFGGLRRIRRQNHPLRNHPAILDALNDRPWI
jgi:hypothetical protein